MDDATHHNETPKPLAELPLVQFTLRHMLLFIAGLSIVCMILTSLEGYAAVVFGVGVLLVGAHVLSTVIGGRLRAGADAIREWELQHHPTPLQAVPRPTEPVQPTQRSQLQVRTACSRVLWCFVAGAMAFGAFVGLLLLQYLGGPEVGWPGMAIGALSAAMVVGWGAFIVAGIGGIARRSFRGMVDSSTARRASSPFCSSLADWKKTTISRDAANVS